VGQAVARRPSHRIVEPRTLCHSDRAQSLNKAAPLGGVVSESSSRSPPCRLLRLRLP
jgi:hypothetical protein